MPRAAEPSTDDVSSPSSGPARTQATFRSDVAATAVGLFVRQGYDATSVEEIAQAAGMSRSTFFRQFRSKEDVIFADHETLLERTRTYLAGEHKDPWLAVCDAATLVFEHFTGQGEVARQRYRVMNSVPPLRDRELVMVSRYERLFAQYLREALPSVAGLDSVRFAATVISTHNFLLREQLRRERTVSLAELHESLAEVRRLYGVAPPERNAHPAPEEVVVAIFPRGLPPAELARRLEQSLGAHRPE